MLDLLQIRKRRDFFDDLCFGLAGHSGNNPVRVARFSCPCCGYPTLHGRGKDEICELCWWEDDGQDDHNPDEVLGGPNKDYSLNDARENFQTYGVMYPPGKDTRIGGPDTEMIRIIKADLVSAFDSLMQEQGNEKLAKVEEKVFSLERTLRRQEKLERNARVGNHN